MRALMISTLLICGCLSAVKANEPTKIAALDFLVDGKELAGQTITVTGCQFKGADTISIMCSAGTQGSIPVDTESLLNKEDMRKALKECSDLIDNIPSCAGSVTGTVSIDFGNVKLKQAKIIWAE